MDDIFNTETYYNNLRTCSLGRPCLYLDKVDSTIDAVLKENPNTIVLAKEQIKGRGQRGNVWQSPSGCAMASVRMICNKVSPLASRISFIQHFIALAAVKTLEQIDSQKLGPDRIRLKWPNDIVYLPPDNGHNVAMKIGGILVHSTSHDTGYDITMSFALNVFNSKPTTCVQDILGPSKRITMDFIVAEMMNKLESYTIGYTEESFWNLKSEYTKRCIQIDRIIEDETHGRVKVEGIDDDGFLFGTKCSDLQKCLVTRTTQIYDMKLERV